MDKNEMMSFYAIVPISLENLFAGELQKLGIENFKVENGGCRFEGTLLDMMKVNLHSRYATRILWKLTEGEYENENDVYQIARDVEWERYFTLDETFKIDTSAHRCHLKSLDYISLLIKDAVADRFMDLMDERPDVNRHNPKIKIFAYLTDRTCTIYLDTSGESLFKRGWREQKGEAALKENLAAGLLGLAGWTPGTPLYDPFCGSGTIIIEAGTIAANIAPGLYRSFGFEKFKGFDSNAWQQLKKKARMAINMDAEANLAGSDISTLIVDRAEKNARIAGLGKWLESGKIRFFPRDARKAEPTSEEPGIIVSNPPYGEQSNPKSASVASLMHDFGDALKKNFAGWTVWMLTSDRKLPRQMRLQESRKTVFFNGPIECRFFRFEMVKGSNRREKATD